MQAIAREFNYPETVFVFPPRDAIIAPRSASSIRRPRCRLRVIRRSAPRSCSRCSTAAAPREFVLEEKIGNVPCRFEPKTADTGYARFTAPSLPVAAAGDLPGKTEIAAALSLAPDDIGFRRRGAVALVVRHYVFLCAAEKSRRGGALPTRIRRRSKKCSASAVPAKSMCSARRRPMPGTTSMSACSRRGVGIPGRSGDRLGRCRFRRPARRIGPLWRRRAQYPYRAGLRNGAPEPDRSWPHDRAADVSLRRPSAAARSSSPKARSPPERGRLFGTGRSTSQNVTLRGRVAFAAVYMREEECVHESRQARPALPYRPAGDLQAFKLRSGRYRRAQDRQGRSQGDRRRARQASRRACRSGFTRRTNGRC